MTTIPSPSDYVIMSLELDPNHDINSLPFVYDEIANEEDDNLWRICPHCKGDGCRSCDGEGVVYDPEPDGTN